VIVVDANVAAKWFLPEVGSEEAVALVSGPDLLFAPSLIRIEVLAALTRSHRVNEATRSESFDRCSKWLNHLDVGTITLVPESAILQDAVELALSIKHTLQDCLYLAAARQLGARLVTADEPFFKRAQKHYPAMEMLPGCQAN
jgi:predicted nucleic acid-binding protein